MKVPIVSRCLARGQWTGMKFMKRRKLKSSREAFSITKALKGGDCTRVYSHFWGLAHNECFGCC